MALPTTRQEFKGYILRSLGHPVIKINVSDEQIEDRIDEALKWYYDYHFDGSEKIYYKYQVTEQDRTNKYITLPENIIGAVRIFPLSASYATNNLFNIRYQIALNDLYTLTSVSMVPYYMAMTHVQLLEQLLVGEQPIRYNRHTNKLYIDMDWGILLEGQYVIVEAYEVIDPAVYTDAWSDRWLLRYASVLVKRQWGNDTKKFGNMKMPDGTIFNGQQIYNEAIEEIKMLEDEMINSYSLPANFMVG